MGVPGWIKQGIIVADWANKKVLVLGLGETGLSLVRWLTVQGAHVRAADSRDLPPAFAVLRVELPLVELVCGEFRDELFSDIDLIAISPGIPLSEPAVQRARDRGIVIVGDIELLAQHLSTQPDLATKVIAITGANGKTTVTTLVGALCRAAGLDTEVAGNISPAVLDVLLQRNGKHPAVWVLELSSFQLETISTLNADAATVLNISEDHLDRHLSMTAYAAAKSRIFSGCGVQVLNRDDALSAGMALAERTQISFGLNPPPTDNDWGIESKGNDIWLMHGKRALLKTSELQLAGLHNVANALAALALCSVIGLPVAPLLEALRKFKGLPHRVEFVAEINDVRYYDDSKGTNVGATVAALQGLGVPAVLIAGGQGKEQDFSPLLPVVAHHARAVVLLGRDAGKIAAALQNCGVPLIHVATMEEAVRNSAALAQPGDAILLSPACASFDMFHNYKHRAEVFISAVSAIQAEALCTSPA
jgi:UDP-N-acetylmuramoylalanine--D-glutamate ligase